LHPWLPREAIGLSEVEQQTTFSLKGGGGVRQGELAERQRMSTDRDDWDEIADWDFAQIDGWCDVFESRWRAGQRPSVDAIAAAVPESIREPLRRELMRLEAELRAWNS